MIGKKYFLNPKIFLLRERFPFVPNQMQVTYLNSTQPLSHIHDCEHDWTRLLQACSVVFRHMRDVFTIVFSRVRAYEGRVAEIIVLDFWACSKNQHNFYCVLWPINGRMRGVCKACSTVWRACSVVFKFGHTTEHVLHTPLIRFNTSPIRFNTPLIRFNTPLIRPPNSVTWYARARHFVVYI